MKKSKRYYNNLKKVSKIKGPKSIEETIKFLKDLQKANFDESVEFHAKLNIDPTKSEQQVRTSLTFPHQTGKSSKIAVFAEGEEGKEAKKAGADFVFGETDLKEIGKSQKINFDVALATPQFMPKLARIAKILGPKGLMPNPKSETVTNDIRGAVELLKKGKTEIKSDKGGCIHQLLGKISFEDKKLIENYQALLTVLEKQKPAKIKGRFIKKISVSTTMGPSLEISRN